MHPATQNKQKLEQILKTQYNLVNPVYYASVLTGVSYIYLVKSEDKTYFVKHLKSKFDEDHIEQESILVNYLAEKGIYIPKVYKNIYGKYSTKFNDSQIQVQEYIEGSTFINNDVPQNVLFYSPKILATINNYLNNLKNVFFKLKDEHLENVDLAYYDSKFNKLITDAKQNIDDSNEFKYKVLEDLNFKHSNLHYFQNMNIQKEKITFANTHGDFHPKQLLLSNRKIYIVDFDTFCKRSAIFDLLHFYFQASKHSKWGDINKEELKDYIKVYMDDVPLTSYDIKHSLTIYARKLIRGSFGYKQFIYKIGGNRLDHLKFGFWQTSLLKNLIEQKDDISDYLVRNLF